MARENTFYVKQIKHNVSNKIDRNPSQVIEQNVSNEMDRYPPT